MTRPTILALPLFLLPALPASAQEGPTFDCDDASTRSEFAICANPELAQLERAMVAAYERYAEVVGRREARAQADELLARRQACEGDVRCNAEQLIIAMEIYEQRAGGGSGTEFARLEDLLPREVVPAPEPQIAALPEPDLPVVTEPQAELPTPTEPVGDIPLAAQAPLPPDVIPIPPSREVASAEPDLSDAIDGAELASSDGAVGEPEAQAAFDTPLSWAFMDLERTDRAAIQARLAGAGFYSGGAEGAWTNATMSALQSFAEEEGSGSFDLSTQTGAALLLDYIRSDAFATAFDSEQASLGTAGPPRPVEDAIDSTDW